jgi:hypothetical protein
MESYALDDAGDFLRHETALTCLTVCRTASKLLRNDSVARPVGSWQAPLDAIREGIHPVSPDD